MKPTHTGWTRAGLLLALLASSPALAQRSASLVRLPDPPATALTGAPELFPASYPALAPAMQDWRRHRGAYIGTALGAALGAIISVAQGKNIVPGNVLMAAGGYMVGMFFDPA